MINNPKTGSIYYMAFVGSSQKGLFKVKIQIVKTDSFNEFEIIDFIFKNETHSSKFGTTKNENLFKNFKDALEWFKEESDYKEQDMIVTIFDQSESFFKRWKRIVK